MIQHTVLYTLFDPIHCTFNNRKSSEPTRFDLYKVTVWQLCTVTQVKHKTCTAVLTKQQCVTVMLLIHPALTSPQSCSVSPLKHTNWLPLNCSQSIKYFALSRSSCRVLYISAHHTFELFEQVSTKLSSILHFKKSFQWERTYGRTDMKKV